MKYLTYLSVLMAFGFLSCAESEKSFTISSPDNSIAATIYQSEGAINYRVNRNGKSVLENSLLGLDFEGVENSNLPIWKEVSDQEKVNFHYKLLHGKRAENNYEANKRILSLEYTSGLKQAIVFQLSNDGLAFKYQMSGDISDTIKISNEKTSFNFPDSSRAWLQPMSVAKSGWNRTNPSYEENYLVGISVGTSAPTDAGWVYPALYKIDDTWVLITESGLGRDYCGTRLEQNSLGGNYKVGFPQDAEYIKDGPLNPVSILPFESPWRVIAIGSLGTIIESNLGNALAEPPIEMDQAFIKPGLASWSWAILKDPSITYDIQKEFVDYAASMNWPYCLVDVNWDTNIGYDKIEELSKYALNKGVGLILWYNSAGDWNDVTFHPKDKLLTSEGRAAEFSRLQKMGIKGIKVDFFGGDGQSVINYYHDILTDAADYELLINFHGATLPRGWHRTYPHLMTMESIKGFEFITFEQSNADLGPKHSTIIPFTRNAFDPMDFTPMSLTSIPNIERRSSPAFELALPVLFLSGIQHIAETPKGMALVPDYVQDYLRDIPTDWEETKFISGYPGEYVLVARKKGENWHVVGINASDEEKSLDLDLSFIESQKGYLITDGNDRGFRKELVSLDSETTRVVMNAKGGFVMKF